MAKQLDLKPAGAAAMSAFLGIMLVGVAPAQSIPKLKAQLRSTATEWLRARQTVLLPCVRCRGQGTISVPKVTERGLVSEALPHKACHGTGLCLRVHGLHKLHATYLADAREFPGLGKPQPTQAHDAGLPMGDMGMSTGLRVGRLTEKELRFYLADDRIPPSDKVRELSYALGLISKSAQVTNLTLEQGPAKSWFATVTFNVDPLTTRWVLLENKWHIVGPTDERRLRQKLGGQEQPEVEATAEEFGIGN